MKFKKGDPTCAIAFMITSWGKDLKYLKRMKESIGDTMNRHQRKYAVLVSNYPTENKPNVFGFVHSRVRAYKRMGLSVDVFRISDTEKNYTFENVSVICGNKGEIKQKIEDNQYDVILIHFLDKDKIEIVNDRKCVVWVHGFEALSWKRRLYNLNPRIPLYIYENGKQLRCFREFVNAHPDNKYVFVSEWMHKITSADIGCDIQNYEIIHNFVDDTIFSYEKKSEDMVKNILLIRSFENRKYANDISINFIRNLKKKDYFNDLQITIIGDGKLFSGLTRKVSDLNNVTIKKGFIKQGEIAQIQKHYGVFLCPTWQDAQGVSMCEAMCGGLVPLTSNNTAIPEFVDDGKEGLLCDNRSIESFVNAYESILFDRSKFEQISQNASKRINKQCSFENTILREIELFESL